VIADALHSTHRHVHANRTHHSSYGIVKLNTIKSDVNLGCSSRCHLRGVGAAADAAVCSSGSVAWCSAGLGVGTEVGLQLELRLELVPKQRLELLQEQVVD
jgi:hypothetical protein